MLNQVYSEYKKLILVHVNQSRKQSLCYSNILKYIKVHEEHFWENIALILKW